MADPAPPADGASPKTEKEKEKEQEKEAAVEAAKTAPDAAATPMDIEPSGAVVEAVPAAGASDGGGAPATAVVGAGAGAGAGTLPTPLPPATATPAKARARRVSVAAIAGPPSHRKSSRSHKRKKFDDEILGSPLTEGKRRRKEKDSTRGAAAAADGSAKRTKSGSKTSGKGGGGSKGGGASTKGAAAKGSGPTAPTKGQGPGPAAVAAPQPDAAAAKMAVEGAVTAVASAAAAAAATPSDVATSAVAVGSKGSKGQGPAGRQGGGGASASTSTSTGGAAGAASANASRPPTSGSGGAGRSRAPSGSGARATGPTPAGGGRGASAKQSGSKASASKASASKASASKQAAKQAAAQLAAAAAAAQAKRTPQLPPLKGDMATLRWTPEDDYRLYVNMMQVPDPMVLHHSVRFTRQFSLRDIKERWYGMLYDADVCRKACAGMAVLDEEERRQYREGCLYSAQEENELRAVRPGPDRELPEEHKLTEVLRKRPAVFPVNRTAAGLRLHWARLQKANLLSADPSCGRLGRMMQGTPAAAKAAAATAAATTAYSFGDACRQLIPKAAAALSAGETKAEKKANKAEAAVQKLVDRELEGVDRKNKRKIRKLEHQIALWRSFDSLGIKLPPPSASFDDTTLAILRGKTLEYHMRSRQIVAGRRTATGAEVDVDLSGEDGGPTRISRAQFLVKLRHDRHFYLTNLGKRPTYVNGQPVLRGARCRLFANSVIEISSVTLLFTVNDDLMRSLRAEV